MLVRFTAKYFLGVSAALILSAQVANAQIAQPQNLPASIVAEFQANPGQLLSQFPGGGPDMVNQVRGLVATDRSTLSPIVALAKTANQDQRTAMGEAFAQVAKAYASSDSIFANQIQQTVAASGLPEFAKAYAKVAGDTGGGGGGAANMQSAQVANVQVGQLQSFQANPGQLLTQFPNGGPDMVNQVRGLVTADRSTLPPIIVLAKSANQDQRKAMAEALAQVAKAYASSEPAFANQIQQAVAASGLPEFAKAYAEAAGDTGTASTGGGGGGGGGGPTTAAGPPMGGVNGGTTTTGSYVAATRSSGLMSGSSLGGINTSQVSPF